MSLVQAPETQTAAVNGGQLGEAAKATVLILVGEHDAFETTPYLVGRMRDFWRAEGVRVVVQAGVGACPSADVVVLHVDLTVVPAEYLRLAGKYGRVINGRVVDISKRRVSSNIVKRGDGYEGPVMVKTDHNYGGRAEAKTIKKRGGIVRMGHSLRKRLPWSWRSEGADYRIFPSPRAVPRSVWWNRDLVVERFRPERDGEFYCLRTWTFLGDKETNSISYAREPIVKAETIVRREAVAEVPAELRRARERLGFDFGKFDYAIVEGEVVLYDTNRTPNVGRLTEAFQGRIEMLSRGLRCYLP